MRHQEAIALGLLASFLLVGCVSQPKKKPEPTPTPTPVATPAPTETPEAAAAPAAEQAQAQELRKKCIDYGLNESMRDDFLKAEAAYARGLENYEKDNALSASSYQEAISLYRELLDKGLAAIVEDQKAKAAAMKKSAEDKGAAQESPDQMAAGDAAYADAEAKAQAKDPEGAIASYRAATADYEIAWDRSQALAVKAVIDDKKWAEYDPGNYELAGQKLSESDAAFAAKPGESLDAVQESLLRYNLVYKKGWENTLGASRSQSEEEKKKADGIKSDKAAPDDYAKAEAAYEDAMALESQERFEEADAAYKVAADMFSAVFAVAKDKMDRATGALDSLRARQEKSKKVAQEGDASLGKGGAK